MFKFITFLFLGEKDSLFLKLNSALAICNVQELQNWKPFMYYFLSALKKIPNYIGNTYCEFDEKLTDVSSLYYRGSTVVWVEFSRTKIFQQQISHETTHAK